MIKVKLNLGSVIWAIKSAKDQNTLDQMLVGVAEAARAKWVRLAQQSLSTTRAVYLQGLSQPALEGPGVVSVELVGKLPNMIEKGADAFSLREGLLSGEGVKRDKHGARYRVVRFRMTRPGTRGAVGQPMDQVYAPPGPNSEAVRPGASRDRQDETAQQGAARIGKFIYAEAKKLRPGGALPDMGLRKLKPIHTFDPFSGMQKSGDAQHRYYVAFRTVSDHIDKFNHPGFQSRNFAEGAARHAAKIAPAAITRLVRELFPANTSTAPATPEE